MADAPTPNRFLNQMLDRLYAAIANGPCLNCRPHYSRQRVDLASVAALDGRDPRRLLGELLLLKTKVRLKAAPAAPPDLEKDADDLDPPARAARLAWRRQEDTSAAGVLRLWVMIRQGRVTLRSGLAFVTAEAN
jgi:hypothetical protein